MRNIAFVVGTQEYVDDCFPPLPAVAEDVAAMKEVFASNCGCGQNEIITYLDCIEKGIPLNAVSMIRAIQSKGSSFTSNFFDLLFFYYSGHGFLADNKPHIYFSESLPNETLGALSIDKLEEALLDLKIAKNIIIILDTCQSTPIAKGGMDLQMKGAVCSSKSGAIVFYSCSPHQNSYTLKDGSGSIYTKILVEILSNKDSLYNVKDITEALKKRIEDFAEKNNYSADFQVPRTEVFDATMCDLELKQHTEDKPMKSNHTDIEPISKSIVKLPWKYHKDHLCRVYFSVNIQSSEEVLRTMKDIVLTQGDLPIIYGFNPRNSQSWIGQIDDSDYVIILLNKTLDTTRLLPKDEYKLYLNELPNGIMECRTSFELEFSYALSRKKPILLFYCSNDFSEHSTDDLDSYTGHIFSFIQKIDQMKREYHFIDFKEINSDSFSEKDMFEVQYAQFKTHFSYLPLSYVSTEQDRLLHILNKCIRLKGEMQTVGRYVVLSNEMERTSSGDELHILTNDLLNYDFTPVSSLAIAMNTQKGVHYYYYGPQTLRSVFNSFRENIKSYYRKSFKARRGIVQWIRLQKSKEFNYAEFLTLIRNSTVKLYIEKLIKDVGETLEIADDLLKDCIAQDSKCLESTYLKKINTDRLLQWIGGKCFPKEDEIYEDIRKLSLLIIPFMNNYDKWGKYVAIRDFCCNIERLVYMSRLTQWQVSSGSHEELKALANSDGISFDKLIDYFKYCGEEGTVNNRIISEVMEKWLKPEEGEILCGEKHISDEDMEEYLSRIHFFPVEEKKPFVLAYSFCIFLCDEGPGAAWYTTSAKTDNKAPNNKDMAIDNDLLMIDLDSDENIAREVKDFFSGLINQNDNILKELRKNKSRIIQKEEN